MKLQQKLVMTPNLQLAIRLLQLTRLELQEVLEQNLLENPVLEVMPDGTPEEQPHDFIEERNTAPSDSEQQANTPEQIKEVFPDQLPEIKNDDQARWEEIDEYLREEYDYGYMPREQKDAVLFENLTRDTKSLFEILYEQLLLSKLDTLSMKIGLQIIGNVDENGYLITTIEEIATSLSVDPDLVRDTLKTIQTFEPTGIAARDLKECMLIQIDQLFPEETIARCIIEECLNDVEQNDFDKIRQKLDISSEQIDHAMEVILGLEPKPGRKYSDEQTRYIIPDVIITKMDDEFVVLLNDDGIPRLRISNLYLSILKNKQSNNVDTRDYIEKKLNSAKWLIRSIEQRQQTLYKVSRSILNFQKEFFEKGIGYLKPLVLRDVADDIAMHESTVSRVSTNKYMNTPRGVFELKYFFHSGLSSTYGEDVSSLRIKELIKNLIQGEKTNLPLSDKKIADILYQQGIRIARRTVAKYREELHLPPSSKRKRKK
ncbi:RNA polymerase factor sigma-54 [bacterium]|nr:RNA polymerase factor sigma-54 [bacterium]